MLAGLVAHLRSTGTGPLKLAAIERMQVTTAEELLAECSAQFPAVTVAKVAAYVAAHGAEMFPAKAEPEAPAEPKAETEHRTGRHARHK